MQRPNGMGRGRGRMQPGYVMDMHKGMMQYSHPMAQRHPQQRMMRGGGRFPNRAPPRPFQPGTNFPGNFYHGHGGRGGMMRGPKAPGRGGRGGRGMGD